MFKATRELIKLRQPFAKAMVERVVVKRIGGGDPRRCYENACLLNEKNPKHKIVSGWFVNSYDKLSKSCLIVAHYWNVDESGNFLDSSLENDLLGEYVIDSEIGFFASMNEEKLESNVCSSILFRDNEILGVDFRENGKVFRNFKDFSIESLFAEFKY